jgi:hypothetical protein
MMDWYYSSILLLFIHEEKGTSKISPNPTLELLFAKNRPQNCSKTLPGSRITHQRTKTKLLRIRLTMAMLSLAQRNNQPTIKQH